MNSFSFFQVFLREEDHKPYIKYCKEYDHLICRYCSGKHAKHKKLQDAELVTLIKAEADCKKSVNLTERTFERTNWTNTMISLDSTCSAANEGCKKNRTRSNDGNIFDS